MDFDGKVALITGVASGIGHTIDKRCPEAGGRVAIADSNEEGAVEAAKELASSSKARFLLATPNAGILQGQPTRGHHLCLLTLTFEVVILVMVRQPDVGLQHLGRVMRVAIVVGNAGIFDAPRLVAKLCGRS